MRLLEASSTRSRAPFTLTQSRNRVAARAVQLSRRPLVKLDRGEAHGRAALSERDGSRHIEAAAPATAGAANEVPLAKP